MIADYALIAEISLFSFGFMDAKQLAKKITTTFKLSSEQLSSQVSKLLQHSNYRLNSSVLK
jgi:dynein heavy chain